MAGFMCAPERFPQGEWINNVIVTPMDAARTAVRRASVGTSAWKNDSGDSRSVANEPTEIMRHARPQPSIKYSGQCSPNASIADLFELCFLMSRADLSVSRRTAAVDVRDLASDKIGVFEIKDPAHHIGDL